MVEPEEVVAVGYLYGAATKAAVSSAAVVVVVVVVVVKEKSSFSPSHGWCYSQACRTLPEPWEPENTPEDLRRF